MTAVLGRYDARALRALLEDAEVFARLERKGFRDLDVVVDAVGRALPHIELFGCKEGRRFLLIDACVGEAVVRPPVFARHGYSMKRPMDLAVVHWVQEQDPTTEFAADRPRLPIQRHPGLGVLRQAFRVVARMAAELGKDGVANVPKFFHDAVIFFRSRLFLFVDGGEQGRLEALARDLRALPLGHASIALVAGHVHDGLGAVINWTPGYQVFPISPDLTAYFHSPCYTAAVRAALVASRFEYDAAALSRSCASMERPAP
jgi:hypothetical protein